MSTHTNFTTQTGLTKPDFETISQSLNLLCMPGAVHELRVVKHRLGTIAGYFADREAMAAEALNLTLGLTKVEGRFKPETTGPVEAVYLTINPVAGHKLSVASNRLRILDRATTDADITRRRRIFIDFDPWRNGEPISSSDAGHRNAFERAREVRGHLTEMGFCPSWLASSGNGTHLGCGCDLPNDDENRDLIRAFVRAIAARFGDRCEKGKTPFSEDLIDIDTSVFNASRLCTVYGTMKRKGDDVREDQGPDCPARPHRLTRIIEAPAVLDDISVELIRRVVSECRSTNPVTVEMPRGDAGRVEPVTTDPGQRVRPANTGQPGRHDDDQAGGSLQQVMAERVQALLEQHAEHQGIKVNKGIIPRHDYLYVNFAPCLFDRKHRKASLWVGEDGRVGYGCPHDSCKGRKDVARKTWADVLELLDEDPAAWHSEAAGHNAPEGNALPEILVNDRQLPDVTADAIRAIEAANTPPRWFNRGGCLVRLRRDDAGVRFEPLGHDALTGILARAATWKAIKGSGAKRVKLHTDPPRKVVADLLSLPDWELPAINALITTPVFTPEGRLLDRPGYDHEGRLWYEPGPGMEEVVVPEIPTAEHVRESVRLLTEDLLGDFPFKADADRANCLALFLLPFARPLIDGPTPAHTLDATRPGTGKSKLASCLGMVALGQPPASLAEPHGDRAWNETIGSALLSGPPVLYFDNLNEPIASGSLSKALTDRVYEYRILGESRTVRLPVECVWLFTGNNIKGSGEVARRLVRTRLDSNTEKPELRTGFRHQDLADWARANRAALVSACLTLIRAWLVAGRPWGRYTMGSYEAWATIIGGILDVAGVTGFLGNLGESDEVNTADAERRGMVLFWWTMHKGSEVTPAQVFELICEGDLLANVVGDGNERSQMTRFGNALARMDGQVYGGFKIVRCRDEKGQFKRDRKGSALYRLVAMDTETEAPGASVGEDGLTGLECDGADRVQDVSTSPASEESVSTLSPEWQDFASELRAG